jgi:hypothetical protein
MDRDLSRLGSLLVLEACGELSGSHASAEPVSIVFVRGLLSHDEFELVFELVNA